jgi:3-methylcrotonyl-CoA carboxylase alpha subunit
MGELRRILIANRGEIAVRVIRACREIGIEAVAVVTPDEDGALHAELADDVVTVASHLDGEAVAAAGADAGADAVHPGYGYLSENAAFAEQVLRAGMTWIGPPPRAMKLLGDKIEARRLAEAAGVPVVPGYAGIELDDATLVTEAGRLGAPLLVKAAAGGGGRGMRAVDDLTATGEAIAAARREAVAAFGDDRVFLERRLERCRHVEVQILVDSVGNGVHLGERDCSLQRRHQKILEESPSPAVDPELRARLGAAALAVAAAAGYAGAGTVEFLLDPASGAWWFLELNARLQVEHPVTEAVTGLDLVRAQIEIAGGTPLELDQEDVRITGHAIEARLYAEDPVAGFLPAAGTLVRFELPVWPGVRVDTAARQGDEVGLRYDPLLAKVIAHAEDRDACVERLRAALAETRVLGVTTNLGWLGWALEHPRFRAGEAGTDFVAEEWRPELAPELPDGVEPEAVHDSGDVWAEYGSVSPAPPGVTVAGRFAQFQGWHFELAADEDVAPDVAPAGGSLAAPMPGSVLRVDAAPGDTVAAGDAVVVLEAMKMELAVQAPAAGVVRAVHVRPGDVVSAGQALIELED